MHTWAREKKLVLDFQFSYLFFPKSDLPKNNACFTHSKTHLMFPVLPTLSQTFFPLYNARSIDLPEQTTPEQFFLCYNDWRHPRWKQLYQLGARSGDNVQQSPTNPRWNVEGEIMKLCCFKPLKCGGCLLLQHKLTILADTETWLFPF